MSLPVKIENLKKHYGKVEAVKEVSFEIEKGEIFGLLGPNGAGKTSIISVMTTMEEPTSGKVLLFGKDVTLADPEIKGKIGVVPQELITHGFFTVREVLHFHSGYYGIKSNSDRIEYLLEKLELLEHANKKTLQLSGGMKRRFLIAKALVHKPQLLLLDEPTAGVDIELRNSLWEFVTEINQNEKVTILLTTHYLEEAERLCDRVGIIDHGEVIRIGAPGEIIAQTTHRWIEIQYHGEISSYDRINRFLVTKTENRIVCRIPSKMELGVLLKDIDLQPSQIIDLKIREGRLEDAVLNVLGKDKQRHYEFS